MYGHDAAYALERGIEDDDALRALARAEGRTLLTRDRELAARSGDARLLESKDTDGQLAELAAAGVALGLDEPERCGACNGELERASEPYPDYVADGAQAVWRCPDCGRHFWKGSHWEDVRERLSAAT
jgi:uncharacterized protein with PIN domain